MDMNIVLFDGPERFDLLPLTLTRPIGAIRIGAITIAEKWTAELKANVSYMSEAYLGEKFPLHLEKDNMVINASILPDDQLVAAIAKLGMGERLIANKTVIASRLSDEEISSGNWADLKDVLYDGDVNQVRYPWDIFSKNGDEIRKDIKRLGVKKDAYILGTCECNQVIGDDLYLGEGIMANAVTINTTTGPVYIGNNVKIMEGALIRGPFVACDGAVIKMGAKLYGDTTIGPNCKVGGEVQNVVFQANSNKGHDGYLGNSVVGEWCNLGADTNSSNLKNNYGEVKVYNFPKKDLVGTGKQFCGLIMGDHSKTGINTMLNTGTVVGMCANIFGGGFPPKYIPSYTWGGFANSAVYDITKAKEVAKTVMARRDVEFTAGDNVIFDHVFANYRQ